jgi:hypothetical protein
MKYFLSVTIPVFAESPDEARELLSRVLSVHGIVGFEISTNVMDEANHLKAKEKSSDDCPECGAPPGECARRCGQNDDLLEDIPF